MGSVPSWITATATVATAILTGTGGLAAWVVLLRERGKEMPIIERSFRWRDDHLLVSLVVRNRLHEAITLDSIKVIKPGGATINWPTGPSDRAGDVGPPMAGDGPLLNVGYSAAPLGTPRPQHFGSGDTGFWSFSIWPEPSWSGGAIKLVLRISSKAETIRNRRVVIKSMIPAKPSSSND